MATPAPDPFEPRAAPVTAVEALASVMARVGAIPSATEAPQLEVAEHSSLDRLIREFETIAAHTVSIGAAQWLDPRHLRRRQVAGLIETPYSRRMPTDYRHALDERAGLISAAAQRLVRDARHAGSPWVQGLDDFAAPPVALYRAKYGITGDRPLGADTEPADRTQRHDLATASWAIRSSDRRRQLREPQHDFGLGHDSVNRGGHSIGL